MSASLLSSPVRVDLDALAGRARLPPETRRAQLVTIGLEMVEVSSFDGLSVDEVARRAGISRTLLFHYFPTRNDFLVAVAEAAAQELLAFTEPAQELEGLARLDDSLTRYLDYVHARKDAYLSALRGAAAGDEALRRVFDGTRQRIAERILEGVVEDPAGASASLRTAARGYVGFCEEAACYWLTDGGADRQEMLDLLRRAALALLEPGLTLGPRRAPSED